MWDLRICRWLVSQAENIDENGKKFSSFEKLLVRHKNEQIFFPIKI